MAWRDQLGKVDFGGRQLIGASFRGVTFFVESSERQGGRRTVTKEFPLRDNPHTEDLGRAARRYPVEGYVLGDDYLAKRDALLAALEDTAGPGQLLHPSYGVLQVICTSCRVRESQREGGFAAFGIEFTETEAQPPSPSAAPDAAELLSASADAAALASGVDFVALYDVEGSPPWALDGLAGVLSSASAAMDALLAPVLEGADAVATLKGQLEDLSERASALVRRPQEAVDTLAAALVGLTAAALFPRLVQLYDFTPPARPAPDTSTRVKEGENYDQVLALIRRGVAIQAARLLPGQTFDSYEAAVVARDSVAEMLDEQMGVAGDDAYPALQQLRADVVRAVPGENSDLARLVTYTPPATVPSLVLAYQLYGSLELELDVVARNHVQNPTFVLGGRPLEVLSGG